MLSSPGATFWNIFRREIYLRIDRMSLVIIHMVRREQLQFFRANWPINLGIIGMCVIQFGQLIRRNLLSSLHDTGGRWLHLPPKVSIIALLADNAHILMICSHGIFSCLPWDKTPFAHACNKFPNAILSRYTLSVRSMQREQAIVLEYS